MKCHIHGTELVGHTAALYCPECYGTRIKSMEQCIQENCIDRDNVHHFEIIAARNQYNHPSNVKIMKEELAACDAISLLKHRGFTDAYSAIRTLIALGWTINKPQLDQEKVKESVVEYADRMTAKYNPIPDRIEYVIQCLKKQDFADGGGTITNLRSIQKEISQPTNDEDINNAINSIEFFFGKISQAYSWIMIKRALKLKIDNKKS